MQPRHIDHEFWAQGPETLASGLCWWSRRADVQWLSLSASVVANVLPCKCVRVHVYAACTHVLVHVYITHVYTCACMSLHANCMKFFCLHAFALRCSRHAWICSLAFNLFWSEGLETLASGTRGAEGPNRNVQTRADVQRLLLFMSGVASALPCKYVYAHVEAACTHVLAHVCKACLEMCMWMCLYVQTEVCLFACVCT